VAEKNPADIDMVQRNCVSVAVCMAAGVSAGDDTEASGRPGRGPVQHAAKSQPAGAAGRRPLASRCDGRHAGRRRRSRRGLRLQQLRRAADRRAAGRRRRQRTVGRRVVASLPGFHLLNLRLDRLTPLYIG